MPELISSRRFAPTRTETRGAAMADRASRKGNPALAGNFGVAPAVAPDRPAAKKATMSASGQTVARIRDRAS